MWHFVAYQHQHIIAWVINLTLRVWAFDELPYKAFHDSVTKCSLTTCFRCRIRLEFMHCPCDVLRCEIRWITSEVLDIQSWIPVITRRIAIFYRQQASWMDHMTMRAKNARLSGSPSSNKCATKTPVFNPREDTWPQQGQCDWFKMREDTMIAPWNSSWGHVFQSVLGSCCSSTGSPSGHMRSTGGHKVNRNQWSCHCLQGLMSLSSLSTTALSCIAYIRVAKTIPL